MEIMEGSSGGFIRRHWRTALWLLLGAAVPAQAYEAKIHQQLTFVAAKQFNQCAEEVGLLPLTPLQVLYVATSAVPCNEPDDLNKRRDGDPLHLQEGNCFLQHCGQVRQKRPC